MLEEIQRLFSFWFQGDDHDTERQVSRKEPGNVKIKTRLGLEATGASSIVPLICPRFDWYEICSRKVLSFLIDSMVPIASFRPWIRQENS